MCEELQKEKKDSFFRDMMAERRKEQKAPDFIAAPVMTGEETKEKEDKIETPLFEYSELADKIESGDYDRSVFVKWKRKQSGEMEKITRGAKDLSNMLKAEANPIGIDLMLDLYRDLYKNCLEYLESHKPKTAEGKARYELVKKISERVSVEKSRAEINAEIYKKDPGTTARIWADVLLGDHIMIMKKGQVHDPEGLAAGTSKLLILEESKDKKYFFKYREKTPLSTKREDLIRDIMAEYKRDLDQIVLGDKGDFAVLTEEERLALQKEILAKIEVIGKYADKYKTIDTEGGINIEPKDYWTRFNYRKDMDANDEKAVLAFVGDLKKKATLARSAEVFKIRKGADVTKRNEATSILADFLGISDMMMKASLVTIETGGKKINGLRMDAAEGSTRAKIFTMDKKGKRIHMTPKVMSDFLKMQVFDVICAQMDRNEGNYLMRTKEDEKTGDITIDKLTGIDNDLSFGTITYNEIVKNIELSGGHVHRSLKSIEVEEDGVRRLTIPALDKEFAERIIALKPEMLELLIGRLLDEDELNACKDRLKGVQEALKREMALDKKRAKDKKIFLSPDEFGAFLARTEALKPYRGEPGEPTKKAFQSATYVPMDYLGDKFKED